MSNVKLVQGDVACAIGAIDAGCKFFAGYPITPASDIAEEMSKRLPMVGGKFIQMEDEIASMAAIIGGSLAGAKSMTATSGPGFSLKQENLGFAVMAEIPTVIVNVQRGGPSTGLPTLPSQSDMMQARWGTHGDHEIIAIIPYSIEEVYYETVRAFNLAEMLRTPVILLMDEVIGHMSENFEKPDKSTLKIIDRKVTSKSPKEYYPYDESEGLVPPLAPFGTGYRYHVTGLAHDKTGFPSTHEESVKNLMERLRDKILKNRELIDKCDIRKEGNEEIGIFAYGSSARTSIEAIDTLRREKGVDVALMRPVTIWPFPAKQLKDFASGLKKIVVPELNFGQIVGEVRKYLGDNIEIIPLNKYTGRLITPNEIVNKIMEG
ncbi:MAG: 2-oxoacid:acceptor oxidoreductase subunit alpha [Nitrospiraceae bacterium]|nr:2-oxoacid:acceptor oxidoreductase subunit alpha [Nitrospiraceae bacterium]